MTTDDDDATATATRPDPAPGGAAAPSRLTIFAWLWAFAALCHQAKGGVLASPAPQTMILTVAAAACLLRPGRPALLVALLAAQVVEYVIDMPHRVTNHWTFLTIGAALLLAELVPRLARRGPLDGESTFRALVPMLRGALIALYLAVAVAKLNTAFLDPALSSGAEMTRWLAGKFRLPTPEPMLRAAIWGTLLIEGGLPLLLLVPRLRVPALGLGWAFHLILGVNAFYDFSAAMLPFYLAFAPADLPDRLASVRARSGRLDGALRAAGRLAARPAAFVALAALLLAPSLVTAASPGLEPAVARATSLGLRAAWLVAWLALGGAFAACLARGRPWRSDRTRWADLARPAAVAYPALVLFLASCPYLGLHTDNTFTMFSNLQTEGDQWNHLLIPEAVRVFPMQDDLVTILDSDDPYLKGLAGEGTRLVFFSFHSHLSRTPGARVVYEHRGRRREVSRVGDDPDLATPPPRWLRKILKFRRVPPPEKNVLSH